jgi:hypothetical protein
MCFRCGGEKKYNTQIIRENSRNSWLKKQTNKLRATQITPPNSALIPREQSEKQTTTSNKKFVKIRGIRGKKQTKKLDQIHLFPKWKQLPSEYYKPIFACEEQTATH